MGLDVVELVIHTEEVFDITIDDFDAGQIQTVGDLYELVCKLLNVSPTQVLTSSMELIIRSENMVLSASKPQKTSGSN